MQIRLPSAGVLLAGWFVLLALVVAGPLLGGGHLILLDFVGGPRGPSFSFMPLPSSGEVGNTIPLLALHAALAWIHPYVPQKLLLVAPVVLGGLGVARFAIARLDLGALPAAYGGTLYAINPFVYDRLTAGQLHLLLGYGLLPWAFSAAVRAIEEPTARRMGVVALWLAALAAVSLHIAGMFAVLVVVGQGIAGRGRGLLRAGAALALAAGISAYWLVPTILSPPGPRIGVADLEIYASRPHGPRVIPVLLGLNGFWREEFAGATERIPILALLLVPILTLSAVGIVRLLGTRQTRGWTAGLVAAAIVALLGAASTSFPLTTGIARWSVQHLPFVGLYREPQKLLAIVVLLYAVTGAVGVRALVDGVSAVGKERRWSRWTPLGVAALVAGVVVYSYPILWGLDGQVPLVRFPQAWSEAEAAMRRTGPGRLLVLPWNQYGVRSFVGRRIVADPAASFFSEDMLSHDEAGFRQVGTQTRDPFSAYVDTVLANRDEVQAFGHLVAPLGVRYIVLSHELDWREYGFLDSQPDLVELYRDEEIELYENAAWSGDVLSLSGIRQVAGPEDVIGGAQTEVTRSASIATPLVPRGGDGLPAVAELLPAARTIEPATGSHVAVAARCTDGWRLNDLPAECHLGAVAAFPMPSERRPLRTGLAGAWALGYTISAVAIAAMFAVERWWASSRSRRSHGA